MGTIYWFESTTTSLPPFPPFPPLALSSLHSQAGTQMPTCSISTSQPVLGSPTSPILVATSPASGRLPLSSGTSFRVSMAFIPSTQSWTSTSWAVAMVSCGKIRVTVQ